MKPNPKNAAVLPGSRHFVNPPWRAYFAAFRMLLKHGARFIATALCISSTLSRCSNAGPLSGAGVAGYVTLFGCALLWQYRPDCGELAAVAAIDVPPAPAPNPEAAVYWNVVLLGIALTTKVPLYPLTLTPATVTLPLTTRPAGFAALVIVTVVPLSLADVIGL